MSNLTFNDIVPPLPSWQNTGFVTITKHWVCLTMTKHWVYHNNISGYGSAKAGLFHRVCKETYGEEQLHLLLLDNRWVSMLKCKQCGNWCWKVQQNCVFKKWFAQSNPVLKIVIIIYFFLEQLKFNFKLSCFSYHSRFLEWVIQTFKARWQYAQ